MSQVVTKFITNDAVDGTKIHLANNQAIRARNAANSADVNLILLDASNIAQVAAALNASGNITGANLSGTNSGDLTLTAVGASPSANGASLSGQALTLQPFDDTHPGVVTASGGGSTNFLRADGTWAAPTSSGANTALSNLTTTSINQSLIPASNAGAQILGDGTNFWGSATISTLYDLSGSTQSIDINGRQLHDAGGNVILSYATDFAVSTPNSVSNSGNVSLLIGTATGTQGSFSFLKSGVPSVVGQVWMASDTAGTGYWATPASGSTNNKELKTLSSGDITNQYVDLAHVAMTNSISFLVKGGGTQIEGASYDYTVSYTGGAGGNTRITFVNGLATGGASALVAGDVVVAQYEY